MIETILKEVLETKTGEKVLLEEPGIINDRIILLERTSGGVEEHIRSAVIRIRCFEKSMYKACELCEMIRDIMLNYVDHPDISAIDLNQEYNYTDTTAKRYCYQLLFDVVYFER